MLNDYKYQPGDIVRIRDRDPRDAMAYYIFEGWSDVPAHIRAGRIATLTWCYNGTASSSWEADITPDRDIHRGLLRTLIEDHQAQNRSNQAVPHVPSN